MKTKIDPNDIIELFNKKFDRLQSSSLIKFMDEKGLRLSFDFIANAPSSEAILPDLEYVESYVLNLRFFIQDNEPISIRQLSNFYETHCSDSEIRRNFAELQSALNLALDKQWPFRFKNQILTYRKIFEGFIYSKIAHSKIGNHTIFNDLIKTPFGYHLAICDFLQCISLIHKVLTMINHLNKKAFGHLKIN